MSQLNDILQNADKICQRFVKPGAFLTSGEGSQANPMTIGWGFIGYAWRMPVCAVMVRNSRFSQQLMDAHLEFTVSMPFSGMEQQLGKAGSLSGRDGDKWNRCGLQMAAAKATTTPVVQLESGLVLECRTVVCTDLQAGYVDERIMQGVYADNDTHKIYYGEILEAYTV